MSPSGFGAPARESARGGHRAPPAAGRIGFFLLVAFSPLASALIAQPLANERYSVEPMADGAVRITTKDAGAWTCRGDFAVLVATRDGRMTVTAPPEGLAAYEVGGLVVVPKLQDRLVGATAADAWRQDCLEPPFGETRAMILDFGPAATAAYVYLQADDAKFQSVTLSDTSGGRRESITDDAYPFEFTVPLARDAQDFRFQIKGVTVAGTPVEAEWASLQK